MTVVCKCSLDCDLMTVGPMEPKLEVWYRVKGDTMFTSCTWAMVQKFAVIVICSHHVRMWAMKTHISLLYFTVLMYTDFVRGVKLYVVDKNIGNDNTINNIDNNANTVHCPFYLSSSTNCRCIASLHPPGI